MSDKTSTTTTTTDACANNAGSCACSSTNSCGCACDCGCGCGCGDGASKCCAFCPGEKTLAFWVLRIWLGFRAFFTGLTKFTEKPVGDAKVAPEVGAFLEENYGTAVANATAQTGDATTLATDIASKAAQATKISEPAIVKNIFTEAYNAALPKLNEAIAPATEAANKAAEVSAAAARAALEASSKDIQGAAGAAIQKTSSLSEIVHHGLPQGGDWTLDSFVKAEIWYMPKWALNIFDHTLGYVLIALGVTLLLGIGTRISLFIQGLLYAGLTLGFIAITKEPGSSAGITMLGVHILLVVAALLLAKHNKLAVLKKF